MAKRVREEVLRVQIAFPDDVWRELLFYTGPFFLLKPLCQGWPSPTLANDVLGKSMDELTTQAVETKIRDWSPSVLNQLLCLREFPPRYAAEFLWRNLPARKCTVPLYRHFQSITRLQVDSLRMWQTIHKVVAPHDMNTRELIDVYLVEHRPAEPTDLLIHFCSVFIEDCVHKREDTKVTPATPVHLVFFQGHCLTNLLIQPRDYNFPSRPVVCGEKRARQWQGGLLRNHQFICLSPRYNMNELCGLYNSAVFLHQRHLYTCNQLAHEFSNIALLI
jgi:hypothetical protein